MRSALKIQQCTMVGCWSLLCCGSICRAEDEIQAIAKASSFDKQTEAYTVASMAGLCAVCLSFIIVLLTCYALVEDRTIRRYKRDGVPIKARVLSMDSVLGRQATHDSKYSEVEPELEYVALVEYKQIEKTGYYTTRVQKQVRAMGEDFQDQKEEGKCQRLQLELDDCLDFSQHHLTTTETKQLELLVLPLFPQSGLTRNYVERISTVRYKIPSYMFCLSMLVIVGFLVLLAIQKVAWITPSKQLYVSVGLTGALLLVETLVTYGFFGSWINRAIEDEYLGKEATVMQSDFSLWSISTTETQDF